MRLLLAILFPLFCFSQGIHDLPGDLKNKILERADAYLQEKPLTITSFMCERSMGGIHDFYSEGDYWWPDPTDSQAPYIRRDGETNPANFVAHRHAMVRFSEVIGAMASAYLLTKDQKYSEHAKRHLDAWLINEMTLMNPSLYYAQAIQGRHSGRGIGIIDMIQMMEVAKGIQTLDSVLPPDSIIGYKKWFEDYLFWVTTHPYGIEERDTKNNHATCWVMQVACFADLVGDKELLETCRKRFKEILLPGQMAKDGSFPLEMERTKPYGYALFNLDAMATICQILRLWDYSLEDGRSLQKGLKFMYPFIRYKESWPLNPDVMYWENWPVAQPVLYFGAKAYREESYFQLWTELEHFPETEEVIRNLPVRNPWIW